MKKNIPPSNSLSAARSLIPGPPGSSVYRTLKEISSFVQRSLYGNNVFRAFKRKIFYAWTAPSLLLNGERKIPPVLPISPLPTLQLTQLLKTFRSIIFSLELISYNPLFSPQSEFEIFELKKS